ncbi:hypothetical protein ENBRE01_3041 [Enteropsectra breve]|nr:hypothetical protein ENBRE01_3041 [Enteropsectra breve]
MVTRRDIATIKRFANDNIELNTMVYNDKWRGYNRVSLRGYRHETVNTRLNYVSLRNRAIHTQNIERLWRTLKEGIAKNTRIHNMGHKLKIFQKHRITL